MKVVVTGARGFVGKNLCVALRRRADVELFEHDLRNDRGELERALCAADVVFHLAGVNRPGNVEEFAAGNTGVTGEVCRALEAAGGRTKIVFTSSIQVELDNPYGASKRGAEEELRAYAAATGAEAVVYRLKNLFGKWSRPNYNTVVATFCHNVARDLPVEVSNPSRGIELTYIDDVVATFVAELDSPARPGFRFAEPLPSYRTTLGELVEAIRGFRSHRETLRLPDYGSAFTRALYATYLSFVPPEQQGYQLTIRSDDRGSLAEFVKSGHVGQIFVSRTRPGITRGNHYHHTKSEKFLVVQGEGVIRLRPILEGEITEFRVRGEEYCVVDIPPGYTHSIENVGEGDMVTLFWSSEIFDPQRPDTFAALVKL